MPRSVNLHVTGFGKFQGVSDNPTTHLVALLQNSLTEEPIQVQVNALRRIDE